MCDGGCDCGGFGTMGGLGGPAYSNGFNTCGIGDVVIPGSGHGFGSGDVFVYRNSKKKRKSINNISTKKAPDYNNAGFVSQPKGGFGQGDLPLIVPIKPKK